MRRHYLDNIRWVTVLCVFVYHVLFMYNSVGIKVGQVCSTGAHYWDALLYLFYPWFMLLLFVVAGVSSRLYLEKHTVKEFFRSRTDKLLVPSTLGLFVWCWAQGWVSMKLSELSGSSIDVPGAPAPIMYLIMCLSGVSVLWFIQLLWVFSIVLVLIRKLEKGKLYALCGKANPLVMVLLAIPVFLSGLVLNTPMITVYRFGFYGFGFLLGYFVFAHDEVIERLTKLRFVLAPLAAALGVLYTVFYYGKNYADASAHLDVINSIPAVAFAWTAVLAFFACFKAWFDKETPFSRFMTKKSFGFYMFHYFGISAAALLIELYLPMPLFMKYLIVTLNGLAVGFAFPEVFGRIPVVRYLIMGIRKPKAKKKTAK